MIKRGKRDLKEKNGRTCRPRRRGRLVVLVLLLMSLPGRPPAAAPPAAPSAPVTSLCAPMTPESIYARLKKETLAHQTYTAVYYHASERGVRHEIFARGRSSGRYRQKPAQYCEKRLSLQTSFPEQAGVGFQECYTGVDDMTRVLMPGAYRALGVIPMFPEDPKANYLNGENLKRAGVWTWLAKWDQMLQGGSLQARCVDRKGKSHWQLIIRRGTVPDPLYRHDEARIWVDPVRWFPVRIEYYGPGDPKPLQVYDFEDVKLDAPLSAADLTFEGLAPGWNLVSVPDGPRLAGLAQEEPKLTPTTLTPATFLSVLDQGLQKVNDYETTLSLELRYRRLRQAKEDRYLFIKAGRAFSAQTISLQANYILLNGGEGFKIIFDPSRGKLIHILPAGVYRVMGEQTFPVDDPRLFSAMGDNIMDLNFFAIRDNLARRLARAVQSRTALAVYRTGRGQWLEVTEKDLGIPQQPTILRLLLDDQTRLPLRLEYRGYDDKLAFLVVRFSNTRINPGLKSADLWR